MTKIYADAEEKYVKTVVLYGKSGDNYVYSDAACAETDKIDKDTLLNLCLKGVTVLYEGCYYMPIFFKESGGSVAVTIATAIADSSTAVILYSSEYSAD